MTPPAIRIALFLVALCSAGAALAADPIGHVATLGGSAAATGPSGTRTLICGDPVFPGDTLTTADASHVGVLMGDALAHLDAESALRVGDEGTLHLEDGKIRLLDAIEGDDTHTLAALEAAARSHGNDSEAYIFKEKTGRYSMLCEWDAPLEVTRGDEQQVAEPGKCVIAKNGEPLYRADAHENRLGPVDAGPCSGPIAFGPVGDRLLPVVGAGPPPRLALGDPDPLEAPVPDPCDEPGSGCLGQTVVAGDPPIMEPPPTDGDVPIDDPMDMPPGDIPIFEPLPVDGPTPGSGPGD